MLIALFLCFAEAINYRWDSLKRKNATLRSRLETESSTQWNQILLSLRELIEWVIKKRTELIVYINSGDLETISRLQDEHLMLRRELEDKRPLIENSILNARQHISKAKSLMITDFDGKLINSFYLIYYHKTVKDNLINV